MKNNYCNYKIYFSLILGLIGLFQGQTHAQVSNYIFSQSINTYTPITGGTVLGGNSNDDEVFNNDAAGALPPVTNTGFPIGFNFNYNGITYDRFAVSTNGWILLGNGTFQIGDQAYFEPPISTAGPSGFANVVSALGLDLEAQGGGSFRFQTIGTSPNQILVVQWKKYQVYGTNGYDLNFQIRLNETSNVIDIVYGTMQSPVNGESAEVGLRGLTNADFNNRFTLTDWAATTSGTTNDATCEIDDGLTPAMGLTFTWTPPAACNGSPLAGSAMVDDSLVCNAQFFNLSLAGASANSGLTYQWQSSADTTNWTDISGATTSNYASTENITTYFRAIVSCGSFSSISDYIRVDFTADPLQCYCSANLGGGCDSTDHIESVVIQGTTLNNSSWCDDLNDYSYSVYPASGNTTAVLETSSTYSLEVSSSTTSIISMWIDYDRSGTFDSTEWVQVDTNSVAGTPSIVSFTVPGSAPSGQTGMRIRSRFTGNPNGATDACTTFGSGETEDYVVSIVTLTGLTKIGSDIFRMSPNPANDKVFIDMGNLSNGKLIIINCQGQMVHEETIEKNYTCLNLLNFNKGIYFIKVISNNRIQTQKLIVE